MYVYVYLYNVNVYYSLEKAHIQKMLQENIFAEPKLVIFVNMIHPEERLNQCQ